MTRTCFHTHARRSDLFAAARFDLRPLQSLVAIVAAGLIALPSFAHAQATRAPRRDGTVPILEYHQIGGEDARWTRSSASFRKDLEQLYARGYRPVTVGELVDGVLDIPAGTSPVVFTFDDASPGQFRYLEQNGQLVIDPESAIGIWLAFSKAHPDWRKKATFCMLPAAAAGHAFFGDKGIDGQKTAWRFQKVKFLADNGFELCNHTLWHAQLNKYDERMVQEQIARGVLAIDSAVAGYKVRTFALPLGIWPKNRALAVAGSWTDPRSKKTTSYKFDAVLEVAGNPSRGPFSPGFNKHSLNRQQVLGNTLTSILDKNEATRLVAGPAK
jgi:hypothetical protein